MTPRAAEKLGVIRIARVLFDRTDYDDDSHACISRDDAQFYVYTLRHPPRKFLNEDAEPLARRTINEDL